MDAIPEQTKLVNWNTGPCNLVHGDERRDRSGSRVINPWKDMSGQYINSSGSQNQSV